ncbi:hypothetical protein OLX02_04215 [Novosphingobium sp. KCTC 2891]|uniref:hypothetical protein n=1 Tax=Novosphingobium sp. KCTC 2891 TaxID=2989730 RepID=UPI00222325A5|nr:hypothetical protein [Novosphingobium sp. KCTC 2891]MCW1382019.1 hypothetical protein [Novosphingobium sp. KCTC 2891]
MSRSQTAPRAATRRASQPITAHRLFPALVALWFAALFGLGSFALPSEFLERLVGVTGLSALVPAAAPPLGITARLLIALAMTVAGITAGLVLGLRLRPRPRPAAVVRRRGAVHVEPEPEAEIDLAEDAPQVRAFDSHPDAPPRKPFDLSADLVPAVDEVPASARGLPVRRRALSLTDESLPAEPVDHAPAPGFALWDDAADEPAFAEDTIDEAAIAEAAIAEDTFDEVEDGEWTAVAVLDAEADVVATVMVDAATVDPVPAAVTDAPARRAPAPTAPDVRSMLTGAPLESLGLVQLVERLALAIDSRMRAAGEPAFERAAAPIMVAEPAPVEVMAEPALPEQAIIEPAIIEPTIVEPTIIEPTVIEPTVIEPTVIEPTVIEQTGAEQVVVAPAPFAPAEPVVDAAPEPEQAEIAPAPPRFASSVPAPVAEVRPVEALPAEPAAPVVQATAPAVIARFPSMANPVAPQWDDADEGADGEDVVVPRFLGRAASGEAKPVAPAVSEAPRLAHPAAPAAAPRQEFIRVDTPDATDSAPDVIEPVVIFPGQGPRSGPVTDAAPFLRPVPGTADAGAVRNGAPAGPAQVFASGVPAPDVEDADRALRAALATLQRMTARG